MRVAGAGAATVVLAIVSIILVLSATGGGPAGRPEMTLPTHHEADINRGGTFTGIAGADILREGDCVYLAYPDRRWLVVWPTGTKLDESQDPSVVRDAAGRRIVGVGEVFTMNGASYTANQLDELRPVLDADIPSACIGSEILLAAPDLAALRPVPATWRIDPASQPDSGSMTIDVLLREHECAQGRPPGNRLQPPIIDYRSDTVVVTLPVLEIGGRCQNPEYPVALSLREPIGQRTLVDGSAGSVRWRPDIGIVLPTPDLGLDECAGLELPPIGPSDIIDTDLDRERAILMVRIVSDGTETKLVISYSDPVCIDHPVLGPIIQRALAEE